MQSKRNVWIENWSRNLRFKAREILLPSSTEDVVGAVKECLDQKMGLRVVGGKGSQVPFYGPGDLLISLKRMNRISGFNPETGEVCVQGGVRLRQLAAYLRRRGYTLATTPGVLWQTVAGAVSTDTHGVGQGKNLLHDDLLEVTLVDGRGQVRVISRGEPDFNAAAVSLGLLGVIVELRLRAVPAYTVKTAVTRLSFDDFVEQFPPDSFSKMYSWIVGTDFLVQQTSERTESTAMRFALRGRVAPCFNWIAGNFMACLFWRLHRSFRVGLAEYVTKRHFRINDDRVRNTRAIASHLACRLNDVEMACGIDIFPALLQDLRQELAREPNASRWPLANIRFAKSSSAYLSLAEDRDTAYISFWFRSEQDPATIETIHRLMKKYRARPHWGKVHHHRYDDLREIYPKIDLFLEAVQRYDPEGVFMNPYCRRLFFSS